MQASAHTAHIHTHTLNSICIILRFPAGKFDGAPWGLFLAVQELDSIPGARAELERLVLQSEKQQS